MKKYILNAAAALLIGLQIGAVATTAKAGEAPSPKEIASISPGREFTLNGPSPVYKFIEKHHSKASDKSVMLFMVTFDKPVKYAEGVGSMIFPGLEISPFVAGDETETLFTIYYVKLMADEKKSTWRTVAVTAYMPGENPSVAFYGR